MNQFNDSEYKRWSKGITTTQSNTARSKIENFLDTNENQQTRSEGTLESLTEGREQCEEGSVTAMIWNSQAWNRAAEQLRAKCWSLLRELFSVVAHEESKIAHREMRGRVKTLPAAQRSEDGA
jgi:hypothetical protein